MAHSSSPARCLEVVRGLGCARSAGHSGAHWLTGQSQAAAGFADLVRQGFFAAAVAAVEANEALVDDEDCPDFSSRFEQ